MISNLELDKTRAHTITAKAPSDSDSLSCETTGTQRIGTDFWGRGGNRVEFDKRCGERGKGREGGRRAE